MMEMMQAMVADENGWMLMNATRQAMGMTLEQARRAEARSNRSYNSWI